MEQSEVDFILTGGDYDFLMVNLIDFLKSKTSESSLESGIGKMGI